MTPFLRCRAVLTIALSLAFSVPLTGCGRGQDRTERLGSVVGVQTVSVPPDWIGYGLRLKPPTLRVVDKVTSFVTSTEFPDIRRDPRYRPRVTTESTNLMAMGPDGTIYEVVYDPADFRRLGEEMKRLGHTDASTEQDLRSTPTAPARSVRLVGWSLGTDMRKLMSPSTSAQFNRTGDLSGRCTATLFGKRVVLTAFHCLWAGGKWVSNINFTPGLNAVPGLELVAPFGVIPHTWKYWSIDFINNNCHKSWESSCTEYDWAIVVLSSPPVHPTQGWHPGWMGFAYTTDDEHLEDWRLYHRGYPRCDATDAPAGCIVATQWAQSPYCAAYDTGSLTFTYSCDTSPGHSGGAVYSWTPGSKGPYIVGIESGSYVCKAPSCTDIDPSIARRITKGLFEKMAFAKSAHP